MVSVLKETRNVTLLNTWESHTYPTLHSSGGSSPRPGGMPPLWRPEIFFRQYINIITKPTAYDGPWEY